MAVIRKFFTLNLETAALIFGFTDIFLYVVEGMILTIGLVNSIDDKKAEISDVCYTAATNGDTYNFFLNCGMPMLKIVDIFFVDKITILFVLALPSILLIIGTKNQNHFYLVPWIIKNSIEGFYYTIKHVSYLFFFVVYPFSFYAFVGICLATAISIALNVYSFLTMVSLYIQIRNEKSSEKSKIENV